MHEAGAGLYCRIMDRRDFLLFRRSKARSREFELSCKWLYVKCVDTHVTQQLTGGSGDWEMPHGQRAAVFDEERMRMVFDDLDTRLRDVDTVRVTNMDWLTGDLRLEFGSLLRAFRARGGRVQIER
jgi:hypothetical protein